MGKLAKYIRRTSAALALGASDHQEAFLSNQTHAEKQCMKDNILGLKIQRDRYLY